MRYARCALLLAAAAMCGGCFQFTTVLTLKADGTGTIQQRLLFSQAAIAQLRQFAALSGAGADFDPLSEERAREAAANLDVCLIRPDRYTRRGWTRYQLCV
jgi:hypothetical protein